MPHAAAPVAPSPSPLDHPAWCRWWRDLIVERYRDESFDAVVPLRDRTSCTWADRVALGRLVASAFATPFGPSATDALVADALSASGFGVPGSLTRRTQGLAVEHASTWTPTRPGAEELRLGILGTVADALLAEVPPVSDLDPREVGGSRPGDPRSGGSRAASDGDRGHGRAGADAARLEAMIVDATRAAVLAYARHVEEAAAWSRVAVLASRRTDPITPG